jgi:hypothetical protein
VFYLEDIQGLASESDYYKELYSAGVTDLEHLAKIDPVTGQEIPKAIKGINGTYFAKKNLTNPILTRTDSTIDFDWGIQSPDPAVPANRFSVEWNGYFLATVSGDHTFSTVSDDGVRLLIDDVVLIENKTDHAKTTDSATISLEGGKYYPLRLQYYENSGNAVVGLYYEASGITKTIVPSDQLWQQKPIVPLSIPFTPLLRLVSAAQNIILLSHSLHASLTFEPCSACGGDRWVTTVTRKECKICNGKGIRGLPDTDTCHICKGEGEIVTKTTIEACSSCGGTGSTSNGAVCPTCSGAGCQKVEDKVKCWLCSGNGTVSDEHIVKCAPCGGQGIVLQRGVLLECEACHKTGVVERTNPFAGLNAFEVFTKTQDELIEKTNADSRHIDFVKEAIGNLAGFVDDQALLNLSLEVK